MPSSPASSPAAPRLGSGSSSVRSAATRPRRALADVWGETGAGAGASIDPDRTLAGAIAAEARLRAVAADGGRIALATGRPASLLGPLAAIATAVRRGRRIDPRVECLRAAVHGTIALVGRRCRGRDRRPRASSRATTSTPPTNGSSPSGAPHSPSRIAPSPERRSRPGSRRSRSPISTPLVLGVAVQRGCPVQLVPLDTSRPPEAYAAVVEALLARPGPGLGAPEPHSTTPAPSA